MLATPILGLPYPEPGDHTRTWEYWQGLAFGIENALAPLIAGALTPITGVIQNAGWTIDARGMKLGKKAAYLRVVCTRTGAVIPAGPTTGNITDIGIGTLPAAWWPALIHFPAISGPQNIAPGTGNYGIGGDLWLSSLGNAGVTVQTNDTIHFNMTVALA
jgi:hypothetical protein